MKLCGIENTGILTKTDIMSRDKAEELIKSGFPENTAVISFYDPKSERGLGSLRDYGPLNYEGSCPNVFYVGIHDIDIDSLEDYNLTYETYFPEAPLLANFIRTAVGNGMNIICQCEHGQSRSAACAAAIKEYYDGSGIEVFADYGYYPNKLIFNKLLDELKAM